MTTRRHVLGARTTEALEPRGDAPRDELAPARETSATRARTARGLGFRWWGAIAFVTAMVLLELGTRAQVLELGYRIADARREQAALLRRAHELELELAVRAEPHRLGLRARDELGMRLVTPADVVVLP